MTSSISTRYQFRERVYEVGLQRRNVNTLNLQSFTKYTLSNNAAVRENSILEDLIFFSGNRKHSPCVAKLEIRNGKWRMAINFRN